MKSASLHVDKLSTQTTRVNLSALNYNSERISEFSVSLRSVLKLYQQLFSQRYKLIGQWHNQAF